MLIISYKTIETGESELTEFIKQNNSRIFILLIILFTFTSFIVAIFGFISPTPALRWETDSTINLPTYNPGDTVTILGSIEEGTQYLFQGNPYDFTDMIDIRWFVNIKGPSNELFYIETGVDTSVIGNLALDQVTYSLPNDTPTGIYKVRVFVWTNYLPTGETRTYNIIEQSFEVVST